jgi:hypothetical protein
MPLGTSVHCLTHLHSDFHPQTRYQKNLKSKWCLRIFAANSQATLQCGTALSATLGMQARPRRFNFREAFVMP